MHVQYLKVTLEILVDFRSRTRVRKELKIFIFGEKKIRSSEVNQSLRNLKIKLSSQ